MKAVLALATLALVSLLFEEKARQVAGDAQDAYGNVVEHARDATDTVVEKVEQMPLVSMLVAVGVGYALSGILPRRG
jgi:hypothetical protein